MLKLVDVKVAKEFAAAALADPIMIMAVNAVLDKAPEFKLVLCKECKHSRTPGNTSIRYDLPGTLTCMNPDSPCHYRHTLGDGYCPFGERKNDDR